MFGHTVPERDGWSLTDLRLIPLDGSNDETECGGSLEDVSEIDEKWGDLKPIMEDVYVLLVFSMDRDRLKSKNVFLSGSDKTLSVFSSSRETFITQSRHGTPMKCEKGVV